MQIKYCGISYLNKKYLGVPEVQQEYASSLANQKINAKIVRTETKVAGEMENIMTNKENESIPQNSITSESDKCYVYYLGSNYNCGGTVKNISHVTFQGMECIEGTAVRFRHWTNGRTIYIPIQHIRTLIEFDSFADLQKERKRHNYGILGRIVSKFK